MSSWLIQALDFYLATSEPMHSVTGELVRTEEERS